MDETYSPEDILQSISWNAGVTVLNPRTVGGFQVVVSDHVKADQTFIMGDKAFMGRAAFDALQKATMTATSSLFDLGTVMGKAGKVMSRSLDDQVCATLRGTALDTNPEQTEMEESPLWGAF